MTTYPSAEPSPELRRSAVWCHLSGAFWIAFLLVGSGLRLLISFLFLGLLSSSSPLLSQVVLGVLSIMAMICSLLSLPLVSAVGMAWLVWRINRDRHPFVDASGRLALNFQLSVALLSLLLGAMVLLFGWIFYGFFIGFVAQNQPTALMIFAILGLVAIAWTIFQGIAAIVGALKASRGQLYKYPLSFSFLAVEFPVEPPIEPTISQAPQDGDRQP